jgi:NADH:ubiquinone oxidoreductase subunit 5 (subunit L)/multisubunit Na+/H+ antiporter MnhA subunit
LYDSIPILLGAAWLLPLLSFTIIVLFGPKLGPHGKYASYVAAGAIVTGFVLSLISLFSWIGTNGFDGKKADHEKPVALASADPGLGADETSDGHGGHEIKSVPPLTGEWYVLGEIDKTLRLTIGYHIDALTVIMFVMVTLIASCIHFYAMGYMHDELYTITDHDVTLVPNPYGEHGHDAPAVTAHDTHAVSHDDDAARHDHGGDHGHGHADHGNHLVRPGRFHRFFQYLSLFCFSMLGLVYAGNIAMVFVFWELVGICSYFLIGFYRERHSASTAANKAFIVNRVGDFGMLIGLMALWGALGTFNFSDVVRPNGTTDKGIFTLVRPASEHYHLTVPNGMVLDGAIDEARMIRAANPNTEAAKAALDTKIPEWRDGENHYGYWLLTIAGLGIFCGCVGKSAQFPLHVWLPDAMEGPTPVSALVHSATMVAAGVYLVGRFYPVFTPEALLVIAYIGAITLFIAATIAITATDIKRVLAYSTVSQLGYMMLALGIGGWLAGLFHLITHAFFKSLLFMCSGSVIHACHTNEMPRMGGLLKKMPWTGYTMLIGCLAIAGAGIPLTPIGLSGYYSKDAIIEQALLFKQQNPAHQILFFAPTIGAAITAFYMFRMWFMTFIGTPRDKHIYEHAHESPPVMYLPLVVTSIFAVIAGWPFLGLTSLLEQARTPGTLLHDAHGAFDIAKGQLWTVAIPNEHASHAPDIKFTAGIAAFSAAAIGVLIAAMFYAWKTFNPENVRQSFAPVYNFLRGKWYFDELYQYLFIAPTHFIARRISDFDKKVIDRIIDGLATLTRGIARADDLVDRFGVDGIVNGLATWTRSLGYSLRTIQTGSLRQYVMFIAAGTVAVFVIVSLLWNWAIAG